MVFIIDDLALIALLAYTSSISGLTGYAIGKATSNNKQKVVVPQQTPIPTPVFNPSHQPLIVPVYPYYYFRRWY